MINSIRKLSTYRFGGEGLGFSTGPASGRESPVREHSRMRGTDRECNIERGGGEGRDTRSKPPTPSLLSPPTDPWSCPVQLRRGTKPMDVTNPVTKPPSQLCPSCKQSLSRNT